MENNVPNPKPKNYLVWAILSTLFCCVPLGIVAIIHSTKVDSLYYSGNYAEAKKESDLAEDWTRYAAIFGWIIVSICFVIDLMLASN